MRGGRAGQRPGAAGSRRCLCPVGWAAGARPGPARGGSPRQAGLGARRCRSAGPAGGSRPLSLCPSLLPCLPPCRVPAAPRSAMLQPPGAPRCPEILARWLNPRAPLTCPGRCWRSHRSGFTSVSCPETFSLISTAQLGAKRLSPLWERGKRQSGPSGEHTGLPETAARFCRDCRSQAARCWLRGTSAARERGRGGCLARAEPLQGLARAARRTQPGSQGPEPLWAARVWLWLLCSHRGTAGHGLVHQCLLRFCICCSEF